MGTSASSIRPCQFSGNPQSELCQGSKALRLDGQGPYDEVVSLNAGTSRRRGIALWVNVTLVLSYLAFLWFLNGGSESAHQPLIGLYLGLYGVGVGVLLTDAALVFPRASRETRVFRYFSPWFAALLVGIGIGYVLEAQGETFRSLLPGLPVGVLVAVVWQRFGHP